MTDNSTENAIGFFQHGFVELAVNNLAAYVELDSTIDLKETVAFTGHLSGEPIYLPGFQVSKLAAVLITEFDSELADSLDRCSWTVF